MATTPARNSNTNPNPNPNERSAWLVCYGFAVLGNTLGLPVREQIMGIVPAQQDLRKIYFIPFASGCDSSFSSAPPKLILTQSKVVFRSVFHTRLPMPIINNNTILTATIHTKILGLASMSGPCQVYLRLFLFSYLRR